MDYGMCPEWTRVTLGNLKTADQIEFFRSSLYKANISILFVINIQHSFGRNNGAFIVPSLFPLFLPGFPIQANPIAISVVDPVGTVNITVYQHYTAMVIIQVTIGP